MLTSWLLITAIVVGGLLLAVLSVATFFRDVPAGEIRLVSWLHGSTAVYRGPGKSKELPVFSTGTTISSNVIRVDLDITDHTADRDGAGIPRPITVRLVASAIVSVGDSDAAIKTAANRFFSKPEADRVSILTDVLSGSGRRAINQLTHDRLVYAKSVRGNSGNPASPAAAGMEAPSEHSAMPEVEGVDGDQFDLIFRQACARELGGIGLQLHSINIRAAQSELAEARRRQSCAEAQAQADMFTAAQARLAREAQLDAERAISDKERELEQARAANAGLIAQAAARRQEIQARANAEQVRVEAQAAADALRGAQFGLALDEAIRITKIAAAQAEGFGKVNEAIREGGENYFKYRLIELLPQIAPAMAKALTEANMVRGSEGADGAPGAATSGITSVIQSVLTAQLASYNGAPAHDGAAAFAAKPATGVRKTRKA
ncbi:MAG: hypothetical protein ACREMF_04670 [Gemmatimonadales bacterium]